MLDTMSVVLVIAVLLIAFTDFNNCCRQSIKKISIVNRDPERSYYGVNLAK